MMTLMTRAEALLAETAAELQRMDEQGAEASARLAERDNTLQQVKRAVEEFEADYGDDAQENPEEKLEVPQVQPAKPSLRDRAALEAKVSQLQPDQVLVWKPNVETAYNNLAATVTQVLSLSKTLRPVSQNGKSFAFQ